MDKWKDYPPKGSAEPASDRSSFALKSKGVEHKEEDNVAQVSPLLQGASASGGTSVLTVTPSTSPDTEPPREKRAKTETEEGEITDSSDEEEEVEDKRENATR